MPHIRSTPLIVRAQRPWDTVPDNSTNGHYVGHYAEPQERIDICLNCTRYVCDNCLERVKGKPRVTRRKRQ